MTDQPEPVVQPRRPGTVRKLSDDQVREIRRLANVPCAECGVKPSLRALGERFGVSAPAILDIVERRSWRHIDERAGGDPGRSDARLNAAANLLRAHKVEFQSAQMLQFAADVIDAARAEDRKP